MEILFKYYGLDWLAMFMNLLAVVQLGNKVKWGFIIFVGANLTWIITATLLLHSYAIVFGNSIFLLTNIGGFMKWNNEPRTSLYHK